MAEKRYGGFTAVAQELTASRGLLVTRQGVYAWWRRRDKNNFPDRKPVPGKKREQFDIDEVVRWYRKYMSIPRQGRKRPETASKTPKQKEGGIRK